MGKVKTIDPEKQEQLNKEKAQKEAERLARIAEQKAKGKTEKPSFAEASDGKAEEQNQSTEVSTKVESEKDEKSKKVSKYAAKQKAKAHERSDNYKKAASQIEKSKLYPVKEALELLDKTHLAKFDETVELHINTTATGLSGQVTLPHGTGKQVKVAILAPSKDAAGADELLKQIEVGKINFDILVATPDAMPKLAKVAKVLGPKGLMPNPKNGTISPNPEAVAKQYEGGQFRYKTEAKAPVIHVSVGKMSFGQEKLAQNIDAFLRAIKSENIRNVTLKSTMSPAIKLQVK